MTATELPLLRQKIEAIDRALIQLIVERVELAKEVGLAKQAAGLPTLDHSREAAVVRRAAKLARDAGLECDDEIRQIFWQLIALARRAQTG